MIIFNTPLEVLRFKFYLASQKKYISSTIHFLVGCIFNCNLNTRNVYPLRFINRKWESKACGTVSICRRLIESKMLAIPRRNSTKIKAKSEMNLISQLELTQMFDTRRCASLLDTSFVQQLNISRKKTTASTSKVKTLNCIYHRPKFSPSRTPLRCKIRIN